MYQSGSAGDKAQKRKSPTKSGRVGILIPLNTEQLSVIKSDKVSECLYKSLQLSTVSRTGQS